MILEFLQDSPELRKFTENLRFVETAYEFDEDEAIDIFRHLDGKYYSVATGYRGKFMAFHKDFKRENPYVVKFTEVIPREEVVKITRWVNILDGMCI